MTEKKIRVRKEVVCCDICKRPKVFLYLSDFAYGQKLVYFDGDTEPAFIDLLEDEVFLNYEEQVRNILNKNCITYSSEEIRNFTNKTFGVACDTINGRNINFLMGQKKCLYCGSSKFERNMIEPESMTEMVIPVVSHVEWKMLDDNKKVEVILNELKKEGII